MRRAGWRCEGCGRAGRLEVDHKQAVQNGGDEWDFENLQALCRGCHLDKSRAELGMSTAHRAQLRAWERHRAEARRDARRKVKPQRDIGL